MSPLCTAIRKPLQQSAWFTEAELIILTRDWITAEAIHRYCKRLEKQGVLIDAGERLNSRAWAPGPAADHWLANPPKSGDRGNSVFYRQIRLLNERFEQRSTVTSPTPSPSHV